MDINVLERTLAVRRRNNPQRYYVPNAKIEEFIRMVGEDKTFISLLSAANGIGKTWGGANIVSHICFGNSGNKYFDHPLFNNFPYPKRGRIVSDPTTIQQTLIPALKKWLPPERYTTSKAGKNYEYVWETDTGFKFDLMTYEQSTSEFEAETLGFAWFDEPPPLAIFKATVARMRMGGVIFITATPLMGSAWMYDHILIYKPGAGDEKQRDYVEADVECACIEHGVRGHLTHKNIEKMIAEYDEEDKQARIHGKFHHLIGLVFKKFNRKIHVIKPFHISDRDYVVVEALDTHPRNPDAVLWLATNRKGTKFIVDDLYEKLITSELATRIKRKASQFRVISRICDPSAFDEDQRQEDPEKQTMAAKLYEYGLEYNPGPKRRTQADRRIKDALDYRMVGKEMLMAPELYVFDINARMIFELEHYQWDEWRGRAGERKDPKETPMDKDDHQIENLGRSLVMEPRFSPLPKEYRRVSGRSASESARKKLDPYD